MHELLQLIPYEVCFSSSLWAFFHAAKSDPSAGTKVVVSVFGAVPMLPDAVVAFALLQPKLVQSLCLDLSDVAVAEDELCTVWTSVLARRGNTKIDT